MKARLNFELLDELGCKVLFRRSINLVDSRFFFGILFDIYFDALGENFSKLVPILIIFLLMLLMSGFTIGSRDDSSLHLFWHLLTSRIISSLSFGHNSKILLLLDPTSWLNTNNLPLVRSVYGPYYGVSGPVYLKVDDT